MKDVFLSYASEDRETAARVAKALEARGLSVWWDRQIAVGQNWQRTIEDNLRQTRCAVVLWSGHSAASDYVLEEATFARERNKLAAAVIDGVEIPVGFRLLQTADLRNWQEGFEQLAAGVRALTGSTVPTADIGEAQRRFGWLIAITAVAALLALALVLRAPAKVEGEVAANRIEFRTAGMKPQVLLDSIAVRSLTLRGFAEIRLEGTGLWIADSSKFDMERNTYPDSAWKRLPPQPSITLRRVDSAEATVTLRPWPDEASIGVNRLDTAPSRVTFHSPEPGRLQIEVAGQARSGAVSLPGQFRLSAQDCTIDGMDFQPPFALRVQLEQNSRRLEYKASGEPLLFEIGFPEGFAKPFFSEPIAIDAVEFQEQGPMGEPRSTLDGPGEVRVSGTPFKVGKSDTLRMEGLTRFFLKSIAPARAGSLSIGVYGDAAEVRSGPKGHAADRRPTWLQTFWRAFP